MSNPGYLSNSELAAKLSTVADRWNTRESQMIALISQPDGTVIVTDGLGQHHTLPSFPQLQSTVTALIDELTGAVAGVTDVSNSVTHLVSAAETSANASASSATKAGESASAAAASASTAASSAAAASNSASGAADVAVSAAATLATAEQTVEAVNQAVTSATDSANAANVAKTAAQTAKTAAAQSATNAKTSATAAAVSASDAATSASSGAASATAAAQSTASAASSQAQASAAAAQASASQQAAANSASAAQASATSASEAASTAQSHIAQTAANAADAVTSANIAITAQTGAEAARDASQGYASQAQAIVNNAGNVVSVAGKTGAVSLAIADITNLQTELKVRLKKIGDTNVTMKATTGSNPGVWLKNSDDKTDAVIYLNRVSRRLTLQAYDPNITDSNVSVGYVYLDTDGSFYSQKQIRSPQGFVGNATSADKLINAKTINGTVFDGTAAITTNKWGAQRNLKIGNKSHIVNGSANITWTLSDIGAAPVSHTHTSADIVDVHRARRYFFNQI